MVRGTRISDTDLIQEAGADAARSVSKWRWIVFGAVLGLPPALNVVLLGISTLVVRSLTPHIDLSAPKRLACYFQNPASYTAAYHRAAKRVRCLRTFYGWFAGVIIFNLCFQ